MDDESSLISILKRAGTSGPAAIDWRCAPGCENLRVLDVSGIAALDRENARTVKQTVFRVPFVEGVGRGDRVRYQGRHFVVRETTETTRGLRVRELEIRCQTLADYTTYAIEKLKALGRVGA